MNMKKTILLILSLLMLGLLQAQVGINTKYPRAVFHLDGAGDNPSDNTTPLSAAQLSNDVIITSDGNVGIGTSPTTSKLEIVTNINGKGFRLQDGSQKAGSFLKCIDNSGHSQWDYMELPLFRGTFPTIDINLGTHNSMSAAYGISTLGLTKGIWLIVIKGYINVDKSGVCGIVMRNHTSKVPYSNILVTGANTATRDLHINASGIVELTANATVELAVWSYHLSAVYTGASYSDTPAFWGFTAIKLFSN